MNPARILTSRVGESTAETLLANFCMESNKIEGEPSAEYNDIAALLVILQAEEVKEKVLFDAHIDYSVGSGLTNAERGAYRTCQVYVGKYVPPPANEVAARMRTFFKFYNGEEITRMDSWAAHCMFEKIHPFVDFNGRVGRALWLRRAIEEGYDLSLGFLHKFYYQTLSHYE